MAGPAKTGLLSRQQLRTQRIQKLTINRRVELILNYGILAPSTHNTQPWKLKITGNQVQIFADFSKKVPEADPTGRDFYISLGALIKNIELAAAENDITVTVEISSTVGSNPHIATITLSNLETAKTPSKSVILDALVTRQNYRGFFQTTTLETSVVKLVKAAATNQTSTHLITDKTIIEKLAGLTAEGLKMGYARPAFRREISSYINHNLSRKRFGLHGHSLRMNLKTSFIVPKIMRRKDIGPKLAAMNYKSFITAPAVIVLSSEDNEKSWLETGRVLEDILVRLTAFGLSSSIFAAAIEMDNLRGRVSKIIAVDPDKVPQLLFCIGEPTVPLPYSVRKKLQSVLIK